MVITSDALKSVKIINIPEYVYSAVIIHINQFF